MNRRSSCVVGVLCVVLCVMSALPCRAIETPRSFIQRLWLGKPNVEVTEAVTNLLYGVIDAADLTVSSNLTVALDLTVNGGEFNSGSNVLNVTFPDTGGTNKGTWAVKSLSVLTNADDNATMNVVLFRMLNDSSEMIDWSEIEIGVVDNTTNTEDSVERHKVQVNGTLTTILSLDSAGATLGGAGSWVGNGPLLTNLTGTASPNGTVLNQLDISLCTNMNAANIAPSTVLTAVDANAATNINAANILAGSVASSFDAAAVTNIALTNINPAGTLTLGSLVTTGGINTAVASGTVTNGQPITLLKTGNLLTPSGMASGETNIVTFANAAVGDLFVVTIAPGASNLLTVLNGGNWVSSNALLSAGEMMFVYAPIATNLTHIE